MARRKGRLKKAAEELTDLAIRVDRYDADVDASINYDVFYPQHAIDLDDRDPIYRSSRA